VLLTNVLEAAIWGIALADWNSTGFRPVNLNKLAVSASVLKSVASYVLVLLASLGWGVWRPHLECGTVVKTIILCLLMIIADFVHDYLLSLRQTRPIPTTVFLSWVPVALLKSIFSVWTLRTLTASIDMMRERKQEDKLLLFERMWSILVLALAMATITVLIHIYVITWSLDIRWHFQWLFSDAGPHMLFTSVLVAMMYLWAPSNGSERFAYTHVPSKEVEAQCEQADDDAPAVAGDADWVDEEDDVFGEDVEEAEGDTFWSATKTSRSKVAPAPDLIGISVDER